MSETASVRSGSTGVSGGSTAAADTKFLAKRNQAHKGADGEEDLLEQKKSVQEGIFACMYTLAKSKTADDWRYATVKIVAEGLMSFLVVFNPSLLWDIDTDIWIWKIVRWALPRSPIMRMYGYNTYVLIFYVIVAIVYLLIIGIAGLTLAMRKQEHSKWLKRFAKVLALGVDVVFGICYVSVFDYMVFMLNCRFLSPVKTHFYFEDVVCTAMPHLITLVVAGITSAVFFVATAAMLVANCDLNPVARGILSSPAAIARLQVLFGKAALVVTSNTINIYPKPQAVLMAIFAGLVVYWNFKTVPFLKRPINYIWVGEWTGVWFTTIMYCVLVFNARLDDLNYRHDLTWDVLYGIFAVIAGGAVVTYFWVGYTLRNAHKFVDVDPNVKLKKIHKFTSPAEVELLARVMRKFDEDGMVVEEAQALGEIIIKAGMATFPGNSFLLLLYANFLMEVKCDGPASRTQLQIASKNNPHVVERYQIFSTIENSKRLKDSQEGTLDLQSYVEFKRNYRAVLRVHKEALMAQREFWKLLQRSSTHQAVIHKEFEEMDMACERAMQVYKRVLERYPGHGKLLKCYGKFQEEVRSDQKLANRYFAEAARSGNSDMLTNLEINNEDGKKPDFLTSLDMSEDAVVIINAEGNIMMVNNAVSELFGWPKADLENANVNMLMPQPFSQRHAGYLQRYTTSGEPHILDSVREMVALHKDRYVFPMQLCVTKLSGVGADCVFLGLMRPMASNMSMVRAWVAPNGIVLCADQQFGSLCGVPGEELVGRSFSSLTTDPSATDVLLERCQTAPVEDFADDHIHADFSMTHRYLAPVPVRATVKMGGTDSQRIFVVCLSRTDDNGDMLLVTDTHTNIVFATHDLAALLGYPVKRLLKMKLDALLPSPFNSMHLKYLKDSPLTVPATSCRNRTVVHLMSATKVPIPVRLQLGTHEDGTGSKHVIKMTKSSAEEFLAEHAVEIMVDFRGDVISMEPETSTIFGFSLEQVKGQSICEVVDVFASWRARTEDSNMQLLMLALLDKENEMPGQSWRVKVCPPGQIAAVIANNVHARKDGATDAASSAVAAAVGRPAAARQVKSACMLTELIENDTGNMVKIILWRRDLLTGVLELDNRLAVRRADLQAGLIFGASRASILKQPLKKFLDLPPNATWESLTAANAKQKKGALKGSTARAHASAPLVFTGPHPDGGTMRIILQGVQEVAGGKVEVVMHPDTAYTGAHANIWTVLGLDNLGGGGGTAGQSQAPTRPMSAEVGDLPQASTAAAVAEHAASLAAAVAAHHADPSRRDATTPPPEVGGPLSAVDEENSVLGSLSRSMSSLDKDARPSDNMGIDAATGEQIQEEHMNLHKAAHSQSEFVQQWVRTISKQATSDLVHKASSKLPPEDGAQATAAGRRQQSGPLGLFAVAEEEGEEEGGAPPMKQASRHDSGFAAGAAEGPSMPPLGPPPEEAGSVAGDSDGQSSADGKSSIAMSHMSADSEMIADPRRGRLYRRLANLLSGPVLMEPLGHLQRRTWIVLLVMIITHVVCYIIFSNLVKAQHRHVYEVHRLALAADRSQLVAVKTQLLFYCSLPEIAKVAICEIPMEKTLADLHTAIEDQEVYHQGAYLGYGKLHKMESEDEYALWTDDALQYQVYLDTQPNKTIVDVDGLWVLGNRYIAAAREIYQLGRALLGYGIKTLRAYHFILTNGPWTLFDAYTESLDYLMTYAWNDLEKLKIGLLILLVVEALCVQLACSWYQFHLVHMVEVARRSALLALMGLPGPVLRQLANKPVKILEDSDDESDDDSDAESDGGKDQRATSGHGQGEPLKQLEPPPLAAGAGGEGADGNHYQEQLSALDDDLPPHPGAVITDATKQGGSKHMHMKKGKAKAAGFYTVNGKTLVPSRVTSIKFLIPFAMWEVALVVIYVISYVELQNMQRPLAALNMASHVIYRYTHIRLLALMTVTADSDPLKLQWQQQLSSELEILQSEYNALMYGGTALSQVNSTFQRVVPASTFESKQFSNNFFKSTNCFRFDQSLCYQPDSKYYEVTHHGLDAMMRRIVAEMTLMSQDAAPDLWYNASRYETMYRVGAKDLYEGLQQSAQLYVDFSISKYQSVQNLHTILLAITIVLIVMFVFLMLRPYTVQVIAEVMRVAGLLSHVPPEMDVTGHVHTVLRKYTTVHDLEDGGAAAGGGGYGGGGGKGGGGGGSGATSDDE